MYLDKQDKKNAEENIFTKTNAKNINLILSNNKFKKKEKSWIFSYNSSKNDYYLTTWTKLRNDLKN